LVRFVYLFNSLIAGVAHNTISQLPVRTGMGQRIFCYSSVCTCWLVT